MGFDNNGNWTSDFSPVTDKDSGIAILSAKFQKLIQENLKESFENCILRDGTGGPTSDINWNGQRITNLGAGVSPSDAVNKGQLDSSISNATESLANTDLSNITAEAKALFVPVGSIQMAPLNSIPGYLLCRGQAVSRSTYADLFSAIGVNFGGGDGVTTFNVPDYRGVFFRGFDSGVSSATDMYTKQEQSASLLDHYHVFGNVEPNHKTQFTFNETPRTAQMPPDSGYYSQAIAVSESEYDTPYATYTGNYITSLPNALSQITGPENRPVNYAVNFFIKY